MHGLQAAWSEATGTRDWSGREDLNLRPPVPNQVLYQAEPLPDTRRRNEGLTRLMETAELKNYSIQCAQTTQDFPDRNRIAFERWRIADSLARFHAVSFFLRCHVVRGCLKPPPATTIWILNKTHETHIHRSAPLHSHRGDR